MPAAPRASADLPGGDPATPTGRGSSDGLAGLTAEQDGGAGLCTPPKAQLSYMAASLAGAPAPAFAGRSSVAGPPSVRTEQRGFLCSAKSQSLDDCRQHVVECGSGNSIRTTAARVLRCAEADLQLRPVGKTQLCLVFRTCTSGTLPANRFASQLMYAHGFSFLVRGDAFFGVVKDNGEDLARINSTAWSLWADKLRGMNAELFESWFKDKAAAFSVQESTGPGVLLFVSLTGAVQEYPVDCKGYEQISQKVLEIFLENGSKQECYAEDSEDESGADSPGDPDRPGPHAELGKLNAYFQRRNLNLSYSSQCKGLNVASVVDRYMTKDKYRVNEAAARFIGRKYEDGGLTALKQDYLKRLWGDVVLFRPERYWDANSAWIASQPLKDEFQELSQRKGGDDVLEQEIMTEVMHAELKICLQRWTFFDKYDRSMVELEDMALPEDWDNRLDAAPEPSAASSPYLDNYIRFLFAFSMKHAREHPEKPQGLHLIPSSKKGQPHKLIFATGLLTKMRAPIFGIFEQVRRSDEDVDALLRWEDPPSDHKFRFKQWSTSSGSAKEIFPLDLLSDECLQQGCERAKLELHELKSFNPTKSIIYDHMLEHIASKTARFELDNSHQRLEHPHGWDTRKPQKLAEQFKKQLDVARGWCRSDRNTPVMTCFGNGTYQWLLPLPNPSQDDLGSPTLVVVLKPLRKNKGEDFCYDAMTVLTLDDALKQARLCSTLNQRWTVSRRQADAFRQIEKCVNGLPATDPIMKAQLRRLQGYIKHYKSCIQKLLPSACSVEDCDLSPWTRVGAPTAPPSAPRTPPRRSTASGASSAVNSDAEADDAKWALLRR